MAEFVIEDAETGLKLAVEGDAEPTQEDAHALIGDELTFLRTNLYEFPGGRFMLDVGPLSVRRHVTDRATLDEAQPLVTERMKKLYPPEGTVTDFVKYKADAVRIWRESLEEISAIPAVERDTSTRNTLALLPENTFLLASHGSREGGLSDDFGHEFTLNNVAQLLGSRSNLVQNFFNGACWGGKCEPEQYSAAFPNIVNIVSTAHTNVNWMSIAAQERGNIWRGDVGTSRWIKRDGQWVPSPSDAPDDIDWGGEPIAPEKPQEGKE